MSRGLRLLALAYVQTPAADEDIAEEMVAALFGECTDVDAVESRLRRIAAAEGNETSAAAKELLDDLWPQRG